MKRLLFICLILTIATTIFAFDELWEQAAELQRNSIGRVPGKTTMTTKFPMGQGEIEIVISHKPDENGKIKMELISTEVKGMEDEELKAKVLEGMTSQLKAGFAKADSLIDAKESVGESILDDEENIFLETDKKKLTVKRTKETKGINRNPCVAYDVTYSPTGKRVDSQFGKVWLNSNTGAPVLVELQVPNASIEIKRTDVKRYYKYDKNSNTNVVDSEITTVEVEYGGMVIKQEATEKYGDFWTKQ